MPLTNAERNARWRQKHKLEVAALKERVAELEKTPKILQTKKPVVLPITWRKTGIPPKWIDQQPAYQTFKQDYEADLHGQPVPEKVIRLAWVQTHPPEIYDL